MLRFRRTLLALLLAPTFLPGIAAARTVPLFDGAFHQVPIKASLFFASTDIDGDGHEDLIGPGTGIAQSPIGIIRYRIAIALGHGDGTFDAPFEFDPGEMIRVLVAADVDTNGTIDLVTVGTTYGLTVRRGNGDGTFQAPQSTPIAGAAFLAVGDITGDGLPDAVVGTEPNKLVYTIVGAGNGTFYGGSLAGLAGSIQAVGIAHLDPDSLGDVVVGSDALGPSRIVTYRSLGGGLLDSPHERLMTGAKKGMVIADFNADGIDDVAAAGDLPQIGVLLGHGDDSLDAPVEYAGGGGVFALVTTDQNGDGKADLVAAHDQTGVSTLLGIGDGTFQNARETLGFHILSGSSSVDGWAGDWNQDGLGDALFGSYLFASAGDGRFGHLMSFPVREAIVGAGDLSGDGIADLAILGGDADSLIVLSGGGDGTFGSWRKFSAGQPVSDLALGDVDGDGVDEAVIGTEAATGAVEILTIFPADGRVARTSSPHFIWDLATADLDGDHLADLVCVHIYQNEITVWKGKGDGTFELRTTKNTLADPQVVRLADLDHDGKLDIVVATFNGDALTIFPGLGDFDFGISPGVPVGDRPDHLILADLNGDGNVDAFVHLFYDGYRLLLGDGAGSFGSPTEPIATRDGVAEPLAADFDGDGNMDIALPTGLVEIWCGTGNGTFQRVEAVGAGGGYGIEPIDADGNGTVDLLSGSDGRVTVIPNRSSAPLPVVQSSVEATPSQVAIVWTSTMGAGVDGWAYRRLQGGEWSPRGRLISDASGDWVLVDTSVQPAHSYDYKLVISGRAVSTVSVDVPSPPALAFGAIGPNPAQGSTSVTFSLPAAGTAWLEVFDARGRRVWNREVGDLGPGDHTVEVGTGASWRSGVYRLRLTQGGHIVNGSFVLLR